MAAAGIVTAARREAAEAGARLLAAGGNAADAAVATAFALTVADPANCGIGGYGGFAVIDHKGAPQPVQVDFNTAAPAALDAARLARAPRRNTFIYGGASVSRPSAVAGLAHIHARFGRRPWPEVLAPALTLAADGCTVGADLARAFAWARRQPEAFGPAFWGGFAFDGEVDAPTSRVRQAALGETLKLIAREGARALETGPLAHALVETVQQAGGALRRDDLNDHEVTDSPAVAFPFGKASIYGPRADTTGIGVLVTAFAAAGSDSWPGARNSTYVRRIADALRAAWKARAGEARPLVEAAEPAPHTTHLCAADADGGLVSMTFTHGPLWFGSGLAVPDTGMILNCGANLLVREQRSGHTIARTNMAPVIAHAADGSRHALGAPGGHKIPAIVMTALIDVLAAGRTLAEALARPRVATTVTGAIEVEDALSPASPGARIIRTEEFYGPASGITVTADGAFAGAKDPRFDGAIA